MGSILEFQGRGGWVVSGTGILKALGGNVVWNSKRMGGFSNDFPEVEDGESILEFPKTRGGGGLKNVHPHHGGEGIFFGITKL